MKNKFNEKPNPIRRSQLIVPFGVGAPFIGSDGTILITCGLDHWYEKAGDVAEFQIEEWRLQELLNVSHFRLPPDYRSEGLNNKNGSLRVPFLRFPTWYQCPRCHILKNVSLHQIGKVTCGQCVDQKRKSLMIQIPLVAICEDGHIQNFPWREWVHRSVKVTCDKTMYLKGQGSASLASRYIRCDCGLERNLSSIISIQSDGVPNLTKNLDSSQEYLCQGNRPWLGKDSDNYCDKYVRGTFASAANVYFPIVHSSIYIPTSNSIDIEEIQKVLSETELQPFVDLVKKNLLSIEDLKAVRGALKQFSVDSIREALNTLNDALGFIDKQTPLIIGDTRDADFRKSEYSTITKSVNSLDLVVRVKPVEEYQAPVSEYFSSISLLPRLRETRVLAGFSRVFPRTSLSLSKRDEVFWKSPLPESNSWLPAYVVHGEGILLQVRQDLLNTWEKLPSVQSRIQPAINVHNETRQKRQLPPREITPRFVLLHTLAHLLITQLTHECGYNAASLRERLYVGENMSGILIYTSAGDSEGTMGGLVRMGRPRYLERVVERALEVAKWCSSDPVCTEIGAAGNSANLAACHSCAFLPETSCEEFNLLLDRALLIGDLTTGSLLKGFFQRN